MSFMEQLSVGELYNRVIKDELGKITFFTGSGAGPTTSGYQVGCLYIRTGTGALYYNSGTTTTAAWTLIGTVSAGSVALANLATGIVPSHVVKFAGTITWSGSGASLATTIAGVAATDIVVCSFLVNPTQAASVLKIVPTTNTITITLSTANTSNDAQISYVVYRAAA